MNYNLTPAADGGVYKGNATNYLPGDVLILAGNYSYVFLEKLKGSADKPIIIQSNGPVTMSAGFDLKDCQFVKIVGNKQISIVGSKGVAVSIHGYSSDIDVSGVIIKNCFSGSWCKNEHFDDPGLQDWVLNNISFHDFEMYDIGNHGFYWGVTEYPNVSRPVVINGQNVYYNPSFLGNIKIYNGIIRNCMRNGVMLCLARDGQSEIYNVDIDVTGLEPNQDQQGSGIQLGGFTSVYVHDNKVNHSLLWGIRSFGGSKVRIENNTVSNSGNNGQRQITWAQNIAIGQDTSFINTKTVMDFSIQKNTLSAPGSDLVSNIQIWKGSGLFSDTNIIAGNTGTVKVDAGVIYKTSTTVEPTPTPTPDPIPTKTIFHKGYFTAPDGKRFYYIMYSDKTYVQTNSKYIPL